MFIPALWSAIRSWLQISDPIGVSPDLEPTSMMTASVIDHVTHPDGHVRIWFGTADQPITTDMCNVVISGQEPFRYIGVANVKYMFPGLPEYTYLPDGRELFPPKPAVGWRLDKFGDERTEQLELSLVIAGQSEMAAVVRDLRNRGGTIYVAQLNRRVILGYNLSTFFADVTRYELVCHQP